MEAGALIHQVVRLFQSSADPLLKVPAAAAQSAAEHTFTRHRIRSHHLGQRRHVPERRPRRHHAGRRRLRSASARATPMPRCSRSPSPTAPIPTNLGGLGADASGWPGHGRPSAGSRRRWRLRARLAARDRDRADYVRRPRCQCQRIRGRPDPNRRRAHSGDFNPRTPPVYYGTLVAKAPVIPTKEPRNGTPKTQRHRRLATRGHQHRENLADPEMPTNQKIKILGIEIFGREPSTPTPR